MNTPVQAEGFLNDASYRHFIPNAIKEHIKKPNSIKEIKVILYEIPSHIPFGDARELITYDAEDFSFIINLSGRRFNKGETSPEDIARSLKNAIHRINTEFPQVFENDEQDDDE